MSQFDPAIELTLQNEGGYSNYADDPGGETNFGITKRDHPGVDIKNLTIEQAKTIYRTDFWDKYGLWRIANQDVANKVFDMAVNMGPYRAVFILQKALNYILRRANEIKIDGIMGSQTIVAANSVDAGLLINVLRMYHGAYYIGLVEGDDIRFETFAAGWARRVLS